MLKFVHGTNLNNFSLVKETKTNISLTVGKNYEAIVNYEPLEVFSFIGGKVPFFSKIRNLKRVGRGNPLLARHKIRTIEQVNKKLFRIK